MIKRKIISRPELEKLVEKGKVIKEGDRYTYRGSKIQLLQEMYKDLLHHTRRVLLVEEDMCPLHPETGWFVPEWLFVDRQEELENEI